MDRYSVVVEVWDIWNGDKIFFIVLEIYYMV